MISGSCRGSDGPAGETIVKRRNIPVVLTFIVSLVVLAAYHVVASGKTHTVRNVFDGDTICLEDGTRVRLIGVDAPEVDSPYSKKEPFGEQSREFLTELVLNRQVTLSEGDPPRDKYGRTLAYVYVNDVLVNGRMIREGWARAYRQFHHPWRDLFIVYEREARSKGLGIWNEGAREDTSDDRGHRKMKKND